MSAPQNQTILQTLVTTLAPGRPLRVGAARVIAAVQSYLGCSYDLAELPPIDADTVAQRLPSPWIRQQLVRTLIVGILIDGACTRADLERVEQLAGALSVEEPALVDVALLLAGKRWRLRRHLLARMWVVDHVKARIAQRGFLRTMAAFICATVFHRYRNAELARRYAALRELPAGTLGRAYLAYLEANHFALPGERGAVSDIIVPHDLAHVIGGYDTTPFDEVLVASFSAGHRAKDPFVFVMFALLQFHLGVRMTPGATAERGYFDPAAVLAAITRGAALPIDLTATWNYWADLATPLEVLRASYDVAPRLRSLAA